MHFTNCTPQWSLCKKYVLMYSVKVLENVPYSLGSFWSLCKKYVLMYSVKVLQNVPYSLGTLECKMCKGTLE